jgi:hypothetical protein
MPATADALPVGNQRRAYRDITQPRYSWPLAGISGRTTRECRPLPPRMLFDDSSLEALPRLLMSAIRSAVAVAEPALTATSTTATASDEPCRKP